MAKSLSFNKREVEKRKQSKKLEKKQRKEERKHSGNQSFEDMIAYVDENGRITSTPPDPTLKQEVDIEQIEISVPKKEEVEVKPLKGRVDYFDSNKGYGFIKDMNGGERFFFHISNAPEDIAEGRMVTFELARGPKGMNAVKIVLVG
ncbi:MAG: cold shock domain-containing protein [Bacteroides sp.]|jgi:cold shock CspA family protein|nr:cold shock domain-containing protein [Bacteroides sp.]